MPPQNFFQFKLLVLGSSDSLKDDLLTKYIRNFYNRSQDVSTKTVVVGANQLVKLLLWNPNISYSTFSSISPVPRLFRNVCGAILCYNVTSSESFHLVEHILKIACSYDSDAFGVVVGLVPIGFTENCRALPRSHCEHITNLHNLQYFEICIASASQDSISQPFDIVARMCTRGLVRSWMDIPLCETNTFRHVNFGWSPDTHLLYSTEFRRLVVLVILNLRYKAESAIRVRKNFSRNCQNQTTSRDSALPDLPLEFIWLADDECPVSRRVNLSTSSKSGIGTRWTRRWKSATGMGEGVGNHRRAAGEGCVTS